MGESAGAQAAVACSLALAANACRPGDTVTALLQVSCSQPESVELQVGPVSQCGATWASGVSCPAALAAAACEILWGCACRQPNGAAQLNLHPPARPVLLDVQQVEIEFAGIERVDASWVMPTYRRSTPPINSDKRKVRATELHVASSSHSVLSHRCMPGLTVAPALWPLLRLTTSRCWSPALLPCLPQVQRYVVQSRLQAATQGTFSDLTLRRFVVR